MKKKLNILILFSFILLSCGQEGSNVTATTDNNNEDGSSTIVYDSKILMELLCGDEQSIIFISIITQ